MEKKEVESTLQFTSMSGYWGERRRKGTTTTTGLPSYVRYVRVVVAIVCVCITYTLRRYVGNRETKRDNKSERQADRDRETGRGEEEEKSRREGERGRNKKRGERVLDGRQCSSREA
ncbi:hypothetical protein BCR43DRAFT_250216 [Syncephalastrum racemosum]|uniref:Transmembrane protein n=1 Tax=Syncephalastrum racemosum TaxID=13706 RepID=A0A1X2HGZ1_SYNRA|nr:hypothetical protein BCR43DRAFT_250216 [Syncephalastrum racemosum]